MSYPELSDQQLFDEFKAAIRVKNKARAMPLWAELGARSVARNKAKVANDPE